MYNVKAMSVQKQQTCAIFRMVQNNIHIHVRLKIRKDGIRKEYVRLDTGILQSQNLDTYKREALRTYADVVAAVVLALYRRRLTIQPTMMAPMTMTTRTATAIPAIAPVVSPPSLSPSPETRDQNHLLTVVQKKNIDNAYGHGACWGKV